MDQPLLISSLLTHAERHHGDQEIVSRRVEGDVHRYTYRELAQRSRRLANALAARGVAHRRARRHAGLERLPPHGAVLRGLRLGRRAAHAQPAPASRPGGVDRRPRRRPGAVLRPDLPAADRGDRLAREDHQGLRRDDRPRAHAGVDAQVPNLLCYEELVEPRSDDFDWPVFDENTASSLCYTSGTTGNPKGALYSHRSTLLHTYAAALPDALNCSARDVDPAGGADVPRQRLGPAVRRVHGRRQARVPGPVARRQVAARAVRGEGVTLSAGVPTVWQGLLAHVEAQRPEVQHDAPHRHRRLGLPAGDDARLPGPLRRAGAARLGHDRDEPAGHRLHAQAGAAERWTPSSASRCRPSRAARCSAST